MRLILAGLILLVLVAGALFGALNTIRVPIDLHFVQVRAPLGASLLAMLVAGWLLGGLTAWVGQARLRRELRRRRRLAAGDSAAGERPPT
ncbi:lipopolysaccharide assembly protein LapA domain-containing protein [Dokdonella sp.]|uniref:lipopolysaccharide assembly protein LapA domain-containing protein n=1 Tax=Dokdonella sp. TaxID=2291710 RepID=UPI0031C8433E|nr:lipopolysaccharide assembly protein LapA domain-containing protein [Dokdonella sp.]